MSDFAEWNSFYVITGSAEDWLCHVLLPIAAYAMLAGSAYVANSHARPALFIVSAATLLLLFVGIHNAWDAVTYHVFTRSGEQPALRGGAEKVRVIQEGRGDPESQI